MAPSSSIMYAAMVALLVQCLTIAMVDASNYRKTVLGTETVNFGDDMVEFGGERPGSWMCQSEQMELEECRNYVEHERDSMLLLRLRSGGSSSQRPPRQCCQQLRETKQECRCEAIRQLVSGGSRRREDVERSDDERMMKRAEQLPPDLRP